MTDDRPDGDAPAAPFPDDLPADGLVGRLGDVLASWLAQVGIDALVVKPWVVVPARNASLQLKVTEATHTPNGRLVRLIGTLQVDGHVVIEPVLGLGQSLEKAVHDAARSFGEHVFPPLLAAFFDTPLSGKVERSETVIGGTPRRVTVGNIGYWGRPPLLAPKKPDLRWFDSFVAAVKAQSLPPGTHWVRLYYGQVEGRPIDLDVTVDNRDWPELRAAMAATPWPAADKLSTVRVFVVIQDAAQSPAAS